SRNGHRRAMLALRSMVSVLRLGVAVLAAGICQTGFADSEVGFDPGKMGEIQAAIAEAMEKREIPGAVFWLERQGQSFGLTLGKRALVPEVERLTADTIF